MRVGVIGAAGRMGSTVCRAVMADEGMELAAAVDPRGAGLAVADTDLIVGSDLGALTASQVDVAIDFTVPGVAVSNAVWCAENGIHSVIGTTGVDDTALVALRRAFEVDGPLGCVVAPNFAVGAVLLMRFAEMAAPWFETAEIIEFHHDAKIDAPSGTAVLTAHRMAEASPEWGGDPTRVEVVPGARGGAGPAGIRIHSVRMRGMIAHQEVLFGTTGQSLTVRHDSYDRQSFMPGVLLASRYVSTHPGVTVGLEQVLGISGPRE